jgi:four helix bundle protein
MAFQSFEELDVWRKARKLKIEVRALTKTFPPEEKYRLTDQLIRSSRGIGNQIAEGHGRQTFPDRLRFSVYARGSLSETLGHLIDAFDEKYITQDTLAEYRIKIMDLEMVMNGYIRYLEKNIPVKRLK